MRENQDDAFGSYETDIVVPDLKKDSLKSSAVVVGTQLQPGARNDDRTRWRATAASSCRT